MTRCGWAEAQPDFYVEYHDREWGRPVGDDTRLYEKLCLEGFQSGLSWRTILAKRDGFRRAFAGFDANVVAGYDEADIQRLLGDASIVRHRGKIEATINNAARLLELQAEAGSLAAFVWGFEPDHASRPIGPDGNVVVMPTSPESEALSKALKKRGWRFVGPTTVYAFMQSMGLVNDHDRRCECYGQIEADRARFARPGA